MNKHSPPVCNYEGSDYQQQFWDEGGRAYEDVVEAIALKSLLPGGGDFMLELGAGAGRNTLRYKNYGKVVLLDYSRTQLEQARKRLGDSNQFIYVAGDVYNLPFVDNLFDGATMIRTLHHMAEPVLALSQVQRVMAPQGIFILEFANKRNLKSIVRYLLKKQTWSPYSQEPIEFAELNFDFHPKAIKRYLRENGFIIEKQLAVSHFRVGFLKRLIPTGILASMDALLQWTGRWVQITPSVFTRCRVSGGEMSQRRQIIFKCPVCGEELPEKNQDIGCNHCQSVWHFRDGIYDFRLKIK